MILSLLSACIPSEPKPEPPGTYVETWVTQDTGLTSSTVPEPPGLVDGLVASIHPNFGSIVVVNWDQASTADVHLEFSFDPGEWKSSPVRTRESGPQSELILGAPYGSLVTWRIVADDGNGGFTSPDATIQLPPLPTGLPRNVVAIADPALMDNAGSPYWLVGVAVISWSTDPWWEEIIDRQGRVVWAERTPDGHSSMHARVAKDGKTLFLDRSTSWVSGGDGGATSYIDQVYIDGTLVHEFQTPGMHHPFTDMPDGSVAYGAKAGDTGDEFIQIVHVDGTTETIWSCQTWLASVGESGGCNSNTLNYNEPTNKFLFSFYSLDSIIEVDRTTGVVDRWWGELPTAWPFDPPDSGFWWQHGGYITDAGTLLTSSDRTSDGDETVVREYEIDDATQTLHEIWNFGLGDGIYSGIMGEAVRLPNGNTLHNLGQISRAREATIDKTVAWDIFWPDAGGLGRTMPIVDLYALQKYP